MNLRGILKRSYAVEDRASTVRASSVTMAGMQRRAVTERDAFVRAVRLERDKVPSFASIRSRFRPSARSTSSSSTRRHVLRRRERLRQVDADRSDRGRRGLQRRRRLEELQLRDPALRVGAAPATCASSRRSRATADGFFLRAESFFNVATEIERLGADAQSYGGARCTSSPTASRSSRSLHIASAATASTSSTSPRPRCRRSASSRCSRACTSSSSGGSQFIIATHSPILMAYPGRDDLPARRRRHRARRVRGRPSTIQITRDFLNSPRALLQDLFARARPEGREQFVASC